MTRALVVAQPDMDANLLVELARSVSQVVWALVLVSGGTASTVAGADETIAVELSEHGGEAVASLVSSLVEKEGCDVVVLPATGAYREIAALLTARLGAACAPDALSAHRTDEGVFADRLLYGGVVIATVLMQRPRVVLTGRVGLRAPAGGGSVDVEAVSGQAAPGKVRLSCTALPRVGDLTSAERIVSFGRGLRSKDDMEMVEALASALGAQVGCSRPVVEDLRWLEVSHQVGLTGVTVQPDLYLAIGISGQIQHLVGMRDSKFIVAINNNPSAPIFDASDLAVVGDLYEIVPRLVNALATRSA